MDLFKRDESGKEEVGREKHTRYKLQRCGRASSSRGAQGAPAAPEERKYGEAQRGHANRAAEVRAAWGHQFPALPKQTQQQPEELKELAARMEKMEDMLRQFVAQRQPPAPVAATPEEPMWDR